jgi:hypothetical protein
LPLCLVFKKFLKIRKIIRSVNRVRSEKWRKRGRSEKAEGRRVFGRIIRSRKKKDSSYWIFDVNLDFGYWIFDEPCY